MRIRSIKPEFWENDQITELSYRQRLLFIGLLHLTDKNGCLACRPKQIRKNIFPFDDVTIADVRDDIQELFDVGLVHLYRTVEDVLQGFSSTAEGLTTEAANKVATAIFATFEILKVIRLLSPGLSIYHLVSCMSRKHV